MRPKAGSALVRFAWTVLGYNVAVILWGAYVRASGSGAGCGSHWPLCNGEVVPRAPSIATLIEYSHRLTSGLALVGVVILLWWTVRGTAPGHAARRAAAWSLFFMLTEAAVGAGLVLFNLVADNQTMARALFMGAHLVNTFLLLAAMALTAWWLSGDTPGREASRGALAALAALAAGVLLTGTSGAVAALGDTLYPAGSLAEGLRADLSPTSHFLIRLRVWHPAIAIAVGLAILAVAPRLPAASDGTATRLARALTIAVGLQLLAGLANVLLLAPVWMQMTHLLLADGVWILLVLLGARVGGPGSRQ
jgi:cytochrome c oxidase assembly protein subunit 15